MCGVVDEENEQFEDDPATENTESDDVTDWDWIMEQRQEEKFALEAIYGDKFRERIENRVWTLSLDLPKLTELASEHTAGLDSKRVSSRNQKIDPSVCKYYLKGRCRFGKNCKFKHQVVYQETPQPVTPQEVIYSLACEGLELFSWENFPLAPPLCL